MDGHLALGWAPPVKFRRKQAFELIPTWQTGTAQATPSDYANYAESGYAKDSLIHSCIRERATSASSLPLRFMRPRGNSVDTVDDHPLLALLDSPNAAMDWPTFVETYVTHLDVSGNVYIEKVRTGRTVTQLGFLRPDRVEIQPGATREDDVFVYTVGQRKRYVPRADIIHDKYPHPANDFYGLSPITVITREVNLDLKMTDFNEAFFTNAGVPFGMLTVPYSVTEDDEKEMRSRWRAAFQGVAGWFKLLIMNREKAEYKQMGLAQKDTEMTATREFVESRICSVYGVPPIIVGALVGLMRATYSNYETAQFSFWSETMTPLAERIARRLTKDLLPDMARGQDSRSYLQFDLSEVRALQSDNTDKLDVVARLLGTGGFTANQALDLVGLPTVPGGDVYIRNATQLVEVAPAKSYPAIPATVVEEKAIDPRQLQRAWTRTLDGFARSLERDLDKHFLATSVDVIRRFLRGRPLNDAVPSSLPSADRLLPSSTDDALVDVVTPHAEGIIDATFTLVDRMLPEKQSPEDEVLTRAIVRRLARRVVRINDVTREAIRNVIDAADREGYTVRQIVQGIPADNVTGLRQTVHEFYNNRARAIARTELANAQNWAATERYRQRAVTEVEILDGDGCGWTSHQDPDTAHGSRRTLDEFDDHPTAHPNCVRVPVPVVGR